MAVSVRHATEVGLLWAALVLAVGFATLKLVRPVPNRH